MNIFITGANRGIGLEFVKQYFLRGEHVIAGCRDPEKAKKLKKILPSQHIIPINLVDSQSIFQAVSLIQKLVDELHLLINNAGVTGDKRNTEFISQQDMLNTYSINAVGPVILTKKLKSLMIRGSKVINITSQMGSIEDNKSGGYYAYRMSKAALNMASKNLHFELQNRGIIVLAIHPGWVRTSMGGIIAPLSVSKSVKAMIQLIDHAQPHKSGQFLRYDGDQLPW